MNKTHKLVCIAMLTALSIVANLLTIPLFGTNSLSFTIAICFFAGIYFGALPAALVGFIGDLIAHFILPLGAYNWFIALSTTLFGVICALIYKLRLPKLVKVGIAAVICYVVCLCGLNTFGLWLNYCANVPPSPVGLAKFITMDKSGINKGFWVYLAGRAPYSAINIAVNAIIVGGLVQSGVIENLVARIRNTDEKE
ncbi:MAG: ECF transporter S component [Clostridiales bacterium]|nr:ECF transporter S component [Clostridiales bacterium]